MEKDSKNNFDNPKGKKLEGKMVTNVSGDNVGAVTNNSGDNVGAVMNVSGDEVDAVTNISGDEVGAVMMSVVTMWARFREKDPKHLQVNLNKYVFFQL